jgi:malate dehydrogenase (quinone)
MRSGDEESLFFIYWLFKLHFLKHDNYFVFMKKFDVLIIGAGATGTAIAHVLSKYTNVEKIVVIEKYENIALVQSKRESNSQTLHFGDIETNYNLDKAKRVKPKAELVKSYVEKHSGLHKKFHKMVLAVGDDEVALLEKRFEEFKELFPELKLIYNDEIAKVEPKIVEGRGDEKLAALFSPNGYAVDFGKLSRSFVDKSKVEVIFNTKVESIVKNDFGYVINDKYQAKAVIVCASGHSLYFAHKLGYGKEFILLPMAGSFFCTKKQLNGKVYTMQLPKLPFAAVHGDPDVGDANVTRFGPTAKVIPMLERYRYNSILDFLKLFRFRWDAIISMLKIITNPVYFNFTWKNMLYDLPIIGKYFFIKNVRKIIPSIRANELQYGKNLGGIRPQIINTKTKSITFGEAKLEGDKIIFNITPSPGASMCLANAQIDAKKVCGFLGKEFDQRKFNSELR